MTVDQNRKLTDDQVREIHALYPRETMAELASRFGVTRITVHRVLTGATYRHVIHQDLPGRICTGPCCVIPQRAAANLRKVNRHQVVVNCLLCEASVRVTTYGGLAQRGVVYCRSCNRGDDA